VPSDNTAPDQPVLPPRPAVPARGRFTERLDTLRRDPRAGVVALLVCALLAGAFWFRSSLHGAATASAATGAPSPASSSATLPKASSASTTSTTSGAEVVVHVAGAVTHPGVVTLPAGTRVVDAIRAAGGARVGADLDRLDLAARLSDGSRIAVPLRGQPTPPLDADATTGSSGSTGTAAASGPINLNTASEQELETLPGIGPTLAAAIIAERDRAGGFKTVDDLRRVHGIGDARFAQLQPLVTV
jgi:competence protein ComEA